MCPFTWMLRLRLKPPQIHQGALGTRALLGLGRRFGALQGEMLTFPSNILQSMIRADNSASCMPPPLSWQKHLPIAEDAAGSSHKTYLFGGHRLPRRRNSWDLKVRNSCRVERGEPRSLPGSMAPSMAWTPSSSMSYRTRYARYTRW